jgi:uncharacterized protein YqeY
LDDKGVLSILSKQAKQRRESISDAEAAGRKDISEREQFELKIVESYLPQQMSVDEIRKIVVEVIEKVGATSTREMGQVMTHLMPQLKDKAEGKVISEVVRELLSS